MEDKILNLLNQYSNNINSLENELMEKEKYMMEKKILLEQTKGAYTAIYNLALSEGIIDENGNLIQNKIADTAIVEE